MTQPADARFLRSAEAKFRINAHFLINQTEIVRKKSAKLCEISERVRMCSYNFVYLAIHSVIHT